MDEMTARSIEHLNADCTCLTLDREALCKAAEEVVGDPAFCRDLIATHPHLLSAQPMFLSNAHARWMQDIITTIEHVARSPGYRSAVLADAPEIAGYEPGAVGVFMGYDFHLSADGPKLIEINTNAGGALINAYLLAAQRACCAEMAIADEMRFDLAGLLDRFVASFRSDWRRQRGELPLRHIAIVDQDPTRQYLYPEFVLFQRLFQSRGIDATIAGPEMLIWRDDALWLGEQRVELVYNRMTDFDLAGHACAALRQAYLAGAVVVTPNPRAHALLADKTNLALLTDAGALRRLGIEEASIAMLMSGIPRTEPVRGARADDLWARRGALFFKPARGFGSKAAYRGDKVTRKVFAEILAGDYVAQAIVPPSARTVLVAGERHDMKVDLRNYTYDGQVQLVAARLYQGQTTNFRTPGGGFAPVFSGPDRAGHRMCS